MAGEVSVYLRRAGGTALVNSAVSALAVVVLLPLVIRHVGLSNYGLWSMLNLFVGLASVLDCGLTKALIFGIHRRDFPPDKLLATALSITGVGSLLTAGLLLYGIDHGWPIFGPAVMGQGDLGWWLAVCGAVVLFAQLATTLLRGVLEASYKSNLVNIGFAAFTLVFYVTAFILAGESADPRVLMVGSAGVYVGCLIAHWALVRRVAPIGLSAPSFRAARSMLRYGFGAFLIDLPSIVIAPMFQFELQRLVPDARQYGIFDLSYRIATLAATTLASYSAPLFALVAGTASDKSIQMRAAVSRQLYISIAFGAIGWCLYWMIGRAALALIFGTKDGALFRTTAILLAGTAALAAVEPVSRMLLGLNRLRALIVVRVLMLVAAIVAAQWVSAPSVIDRFAISLAIGYAAAALATAELNRRERWGRARC
jgi:O-antigen/teichoic acid export membrane protein